MTTLQDFVGTWRSERGSPYSTMTFTWEVTDEGARGDWIIEAAAPPPGAAGWISNPGPTRLQVRVGTPALEEGRLLFTINDGPYIAEFRLLDGDEALVGAAVDKLPAELTGPEYARSIEGHRVRMRRQ